MSTMVTGFTAGTILAFRMIAACFSHFQLFLAAGSLDTLSTFTLTIKITLRSFRPFSAVPVAPTQKGLSTRAANLDVAVIVSQTTASAIVTITVPRAWLSFLFRQAARTQEL